MEIKKKEILDFIDLPKALQNHFKELVDVLQKIDQKKYKIKNIQDVFLIIPLYDGICHVEDGFAGEHIFDIPVWWLWFPLNEVKKEAIEILNKERLIKNKKPKVIGMITQSDIDTVESIKRKLKSYSNKYFEVIPELETLDKIVENLKIAPLSYREAPKSDIKKGYQTLVCENCGWWGSSKLKGSVRRITYTGDYAYGCCPVCGNIDLELK